MNTVSKLVLGTANFTGPYGVLSNGYALGSKEINSILEQLIYHGVDQLDTALGYGDITQVVSRDILKQFKIVTKISVRWNTDELLQKMEIYQGLNLHTVLVHDPDNLSQTNQTALCHQFDAVRAAYGVQKIGVSAYDIEQVKLFSRLYTPDVIQIPVNPLNQRFNTPSFIEYIEKNRIEVQARSLFLQGILLAEHLPRKLETLQEPLVFIKNRLKAYSSSLQGLLLWAFSHTWIKHWVLGVSSLVDVQEILKALSVDTRNMKIPVFDACDHPLVDPRNWS